MAREKARTARGVATSIECGRRFGTLSVSQEISFDEPRAYRLPSDRRRDVVYLEGPWVVEEDSIVRPDAGSEASTVVLGYTGTNVNAVMSAAAEASVTVSRDSCPIAERVRGLDVMVPGRFSIVEVRESRSYSLIRDPNPDSHELRLETRSAGLRIRAITFTGCAER